MRTLLVTFDYPPMIGGISSALGILWQRAGNEDSVVLAPGAVGSRQFDTGRPGRTLRFPVVRGDGVTAKLVNLLSCLVWFSFALVRYRPEVVIAGQIRRAGPIARVWSMCTRRPFCLWVYGGETSPDFSRSTWTNTYVRRILRAARFVFTISPYTTRTMLDFGLANDRVVEVPLGVGEDLRPRAKNPDYAARLGLDGKLVLLTVGRLVERKGVDTMLQALAELDDDLPPWRYVVVSDGPYRATLEALAARLGIDDKVVFTGYVEQPELLTYYNLCDIFAMPNREVMTGDESSLSVEGFGMVFVDAAACAKPVIGGRSGGAVDAIADGVNGFLVPPGDTDALRAAILKLTDAGLREQMGAAGVKLSARFRWSRSADALRPFLSGEVPMSGPSS